MGMFDDSDPSSASSSEDDLSDIEEQDSEDESFSEEDGESDNWEGDDESSNDEDPGYNPPVLVTLLPPPQARDSMKRSCEEDGDNPEENPAKSMKLDETLEDIPEGEDVITIRFRLPSGASMRRNFRQSSTLQDLVCFVSTHPETPFTFDILRRPSEVISVRQAEMEKTLEELGVTRSEVLFIRQMNKE